MHEGEYGTVHMCEGVRDFINPSANSFNIIIYVGNDHMFVEDCKRTNLTINKQTKSISPLICSTILRK